MKTIEERAKQLMDTLPCDEPKSLVYVAYKLGATEQDTIAYLRGRNDALKEMAEVIEQKEREVIEKAWQFIETIIIRDGHATEDFVEELTWRFKNAMEE